MTATHLLACTLTGVDAQTDVAELAELASEYHFAEFGILLSHSQPGNENRYPYLPEIDSILDALINASAAVALHVCGTKAVHDFVACDAATRALAGRCGRVQLNFAAPRTQFTLADLDAAIVDFGRPVITQHNSVNAHVSAALAAPNHQVLFDSSGGLGLRAKSWPQALAGKTCGFAGGIGPDTVLADLSTAGAAAAGTPFWIDMESSLRTNDRFDLSICRQVLSAVRDELQSPSV